MTPIPSSPFINNFAHLRCIFQLSLVTQLHHFRDLAALLQTLQKMIRKRISTRGIKAAFNGASAEKGYRCAGHIFEVLKLVDEEHF